MLVDEQVRYDFYESRIPAGIFNVPLFEKWRRQAERDDPKRLQMSRRDLMLHGAEDATVERFPDWVEINGDRYPLTYALEAGSQEDGVTVTVPLGKLHSLPIEPFEWLVPGWLGEKIIELMRHVAEGVANEVCAGAGYGPRDRGDGAVSIWRALQVLAKELSRRIGEPVSPRDFDAADLPGNLRMNFRIIDEQGREVASGRDLVAIRKQLGIAAAAANLSSVPDTQFQKDGLTRWDFGDLPEHTEIRRGEMTVLGYPALIDHKTSVSLRLLESREAQRTSMRAGLRRLFMLQLSAEIKQLSRSLPGFETMSLHYSTIGPADQLRDDLVQMIADRALFDEGAADVRTQEEFVRRAGEGWRRLSKAMNEVVEPVSAALAMYADLQPRLQRTFPPAMAESISDLTEQMRWLFAPRFVVRTPAAWLKHLPRFAKAIDVRLRKLLDAGLARDMTALHEVRPLWKQYVQRAPRMRRRAGTIRSSSCIGGCWKSCACRRCAGIENIDSHFGEAVAIAVGKGREISQRAASVSDRFLPRPKNRSLTLAARIE